MSSRPSLPAGSSIITDEHSVTPIVREAFSKIEDPRLREIVGTVIQHLHDCVRELRLTQEEWEQAIGFLKGVCLATNDRYNGPMAMSDLLGVSSLVCAMNDRTRSRDSEYQTASSVMGPLWRANAPLLPNGSSLLRSPTTGDPLVVRGRVLDTSGNPLRQVAVHVWQASPAGLYENQDKNQAEMNLRGQFCTDDDGRFEFTSVVPSGYPGTGTEPLATLLRRAKRHPFRPAHIHFIFHKQGFSTLVSQIFDPHCPHVHRDVAFGVTESLLGDFRRHDEPAPVSGMASPWYSLDHTFILVAGEARLPLPPID